MSDYCDYVVNSVKEKNVYYFTTSQLSSHVPHYFICVSSRDPDGVKGFVCCTTQFQKRKEFLDKHHHPYETLVRLKKSNMNGITEDECYVDCNTYFTFGHPDLRRKCLQRDLKQVGVLEEIYFEQLLIGLYSSKLIDRRIKNFFEGMHFDMFEKE